jgi:CxxC motif-containing protein (DUF1111 family)
VNPTVLINDGANSIAAFHHQPSRSRSPGAETHTRHGKYPGAVGGAQHSGRRLCRSDWRQHAGDHCAEPGGRLEGKIHGEAVQVPVLEAPGQTRIGRFGWKDQHGSLLSFIGDAYMNEMGVTNRLRPHDTTTIGKITPDPEDKPDNLGLANIDHFAQFVRGTKVPPRDAALAATPAAQAGQAHFEQVGCNTCHVETTTTAPAGTVINGGQFSVPEALGNKIILPYSDFLLHDAGTSDGVMQNSPQDTANKLALPHCGVCA